MGNTVVIASDGTCPLPAGTDVRATPDPAALAALRASLAHPPEVGADVVRPTNRGFTGGLHVVDEDSRRAAEDAIFAELLRGDLGLVARALNKPVSFRITRYLLCKLPVTPNQVTIGAGLLGLVGCALVATGRHALVVAGLFLAHVQSVLDGCDGELARVRFQQSATGEWLDTIVDDALNLALTLSLAMGFSRGAGPRWGVTLALAAAAMLLVYNAVAYRELLRQGEGGEVLKVRWWWRRGGDMKAMLTGDRRVSVSRIVLAAGRRDFFVLSWFLLAAVGLLPVVPVYAFSMALPAFVVAIGQLVAAPPPHP